MFKNIISIFIFLSVITFAQTNEPKIVVQPDDFDFGIITQGDKVSHDFKIVNEGNGELRIINVRASCGCTAATPAKTNLQPGDSTVLTVVFNSEGKTGKQNKAVYIKTNDPSNTIYNIKFTGNVVTERPVLSNDPEIFLPETEHDFGKVSEGKVVDYNFTFTNKGNSNLEIQDIKTSCGCTAAVVSSKSIEPGKDGVVKVELDTKNHSGKMVRTVTIKSNDPKEPSSTITISAEVIKG